jgi:hypothetical protein
VLTGTSYTFVLTEVGGAPTPVVLEYPVPAASATDAQVVVLNAAGSLQPLDVFIERQGADIAAATPRGALAHRDVLGPGGLAPGEWEITLTAAGDRANVVVATPAFTVAAATTTVFVIVDGANEGTVPAQVLLLGQSSALLSDRNARAGVRFINAANDRAARDFAIDSQFSPPLFAAAPFAAPTDYVLVAPGEHAANVTPPGNPGVLELAQTMIFGATALQTVLVTGDAGALAHTLVVDDGRRVASEARVRFFNGAPQFTALDFLIVPPGTADYSTVFPAATITPPGASSLIPVVPGTYDLVLRQSGTATIVAGPTPITLVAAGLYGALAVNGADTATANVVLFDDF